MHTSLFTPPFSHQVIPAGADVSDSVLCKLQPASLSTPLCSHQVIPAGADVTDSVPLFTPPCSHQVIAAGADFSDSGICYRRAPTSRIRLPPCSHLPVHTSLSTPHCSHLPVHTTSFTPGDTGGRRCLGCGSLLHASGLRSSGLTP